MCGIAGYIGKKKASGLLLSSIRNLEYRGYDSIGMATISEGGIRLSKGKGKVSEVDSSLAFSELPGTIGIAHTRWATHGEPSEKNAHPHLSQSGKTAIVHNGIIENYLELKETLRGSAFKSETDSEVVAHLLEKNYSGSLKDALLKTVQQLQGTYAICAIRPDSKEIAVARNGSPLAIGLGNGENFIGSDISAFVEHTKKVVYLDDFQLASVKENSVELFEGNGNPVAPEPKTINWDVEKAQKQGYKHFMLKEIHEQPQVVRDSLSIPIPELEKPRKIFIVACGTAGYAGLTGKYILERYARTQVEVAYASEFRYSDPVIGPEDLLIAISQSGETADTLAALRLAKQKGAKTLGIINVQESTIARESDSVIYTRAGPEIGVASTKAFISQLVVLYRVAEKLSGTRIPLSPIPGKIQEILSQGEKIREVAKKYFKVYNFLYIGRNFNFPIALEGALKLKEISYIHAEGYASGEMKHGPIALVCDEVPTVSIAPKDAVYPKIVSNMQEVRARNGDVIAVATEGDSSISSHATDVLYIPETEETLYPLLSVVPLQLFAYHVADLRDCDVDKPRNLAKSVTVE
ncbi:glutamine--fructose-6-phosphate transaminase (isomerizing) [Candidatus Micrarchaeota archaeon]|nr:glutamine--fructose-6-phosphate transaminase (isomerizing) [Candidatus Micrarchaeota archaeon]MBD3417979.1 glutamine--fructose-6-phosphate transaminase (isomerizing) [Candidatus Micrarchaeota archaeon]